MALLPIIIPAIIICLCITIVPILLFILLKRHFIQRHHLFQELERRAIKAKIFRKRLGVGPIGDRRLDDIFVSNNIDDDNNVNDDDNDDSTERSTSVDINDNSGNQPTTARELRQLATIQDRLWREERAEADRQRLIQTWRVEAGFSENEGSSRRGLGYRYPRIGTGRSVGAGTYFEDGASVYSAPSAVGRRQPPSYRSGERGGELQYPLRALRGGQDSQGFFQRMDRLHEVVDAEKERLEVPHERVKQVERDTDVRESRVAKLDESVQADNLLDIENQDEPEERGKIAQSMGEIVKELRPSTSHSDSNL